MTAPSPASTAATREVLLYLFDDVEVLDFAGPLEVFSIAGIGRAVRPFRVRIVARSTAPLTARHGLRVVPDLSLDEVESADLIIVPGGRGTRPLLGDPITLDWLAEWVPRAEITLSVCTGALLLGAAGLLRGLDATTHHGAFGELREIAPETRVMEHARVVDNGSIVTSAGISAGIDAALHIVSRLEGHATAVETAVDMEYDWTVGRGLVVPRAQGTK